MDGLDQTNGQAQVDGLDQTNGQAAGEPMKEHPKWDRQMELETMARDYGRVRYLKQVREAEERGDAAAVGAARALMVRVLEPTEKAIRQGIEDAANGKPGYFATAGIFIKDVDTSLLAYLTARIALSPTGQTKLTPLASRLGRAVEDEVRVAAFAKANPGLLKTVMKDLNQRTGSDDWKRTVTIHVMNKKGFPWEPWGDKRCIQVGSFLLSKFMDATDLLKVETVTRFKRAQVLVRLAPKVREWINESNNYRSLLVPAYLPCVIPPKPWTGMTGGGYWLEDVLRPTELIRTHGKTGPTEVGQEVYDAVNRLQETPWRVNTAVLGVMKQVWENGLDTPVLPNAEPTPLPPRPADIDTNKESLKTWKQAAHEVHRYNAKSLSERLHVATSLSIAEMLAAEGDIYFPYNLDFRGRIYPLPATFQPQGPDYVRSLLEFGEAKPIDDWVAAGWLAVHGANMFGADKISLEDRVGWVEDHNDDICRVANDPLVERWWMEADEPWQFLAFCFEWAGFLEHGLGFPSRLPVGVDGTCNGLQHYSAMLRDPIGGKATNLVSGEEPEDIYQRVADRVLEHLNEADDSFGQRWRAAGLIDRKVTKRPVMVLPYGGTTASCNEYVAAAVREKWKAGAPNPFHPDEEYEALLYLGKVVWASIGEVVVAARAGMDWLKKVSRLMAARNILPSWTTPSGFVVVQDYPDAVPKRIRTYFKGTAVRLAYDENTDKQAVSRNVNAIAPNFVHSMDASALVDTINIAAGNGVTAFTAIHDYYGTHAADMAVLGACLRHAFVDMYEANDVLEQFRRKALEMLPEQDHKKVPPLPPKGSLDLSKVLESDFFFA